MVCRKGLFFYIGGHPKRSHLEPRAVSAIVGLVPKGGKRPFLHRFLLKQGSFRFWAC